MSFNLNSVHLTMKPPRLAMLRQVTASPYRRPVGKKDCGELLPRLRCRKNGGFHHGFMVISCHLPAKNGDVRIFRFLGKCHLKSPFNVNMIMIVKTWFDERKCHANMSTPISGISQVSPEKRTISPARIIRAQPAVES